MAGFYPDRERRQISPSRLPSAEVDRVAGVVKVIIPAISNLMETIEKVNGLSLKSKELQESVASLNSLVEQFRELGYEKLENLAGAARTWVTAFRKLAAGDVPNALAMLSDVHGYIQKTGEFGGWLEERFDQHEPFWFVECWHYDPDFVSPTANALLEKASQSAEKAATRHFREGDPSFNGFKGISLLCKAWRDYDSAQVDFNNYEFDKLSSERNLVAPSVEAESFFMKADPNTFGVFLQINQMYKHLLSAIQEFAGLMEKAFHSVFVPSTSSLAKVRHEIDGAKEAAVKAGPEYAKAFEPRIQRLDTQLKNLERIGRPSKRDFGKFSGLISAFVFLTVFSVLSWANASFSTALDSKSIIGYSATFGLVAGFGVGALKYWNLFKA